MQVEYEYVFLFIQISGHQSAYEELLGVTRWLSCVRVNSQQCQFYCSHIEQLVHTHQIQHRPKAVDLLYMQCRHIYFSPGNFGWI